MSELDAVLDVHKQIEYQLEKNFGARGTGLKDKLASVRAPLPDALQQRLRFVLSVHMKLVLDDEYRIPDRARYLRSCEHTVEELQALSNQYRAQAAERERAAAAAAAAARAALVTSSLYSRHWRSALAGAGVVCVLLAVFGVMFWMAPEKSMQPLAMAPTATGPQAANTNTGVAAPVTAPSTEAAKPTAATSVARSPQASPATGSDDSAQPASAGQADSQGQDGPQGQASAHAEDADPAEQGKEAAADTPPASDWALVRLSAPRIVYGESAWGGPQATVRVTVTNHSERALSSVRLAARLYVDGDSAPAVQVATGQNFGGGLPLDFGHNGLGPGQSRAMSVRVGTGASSEAWLAPQVLQASSRRLSLAVVEYAEGGDDPIAYTGPWIDSGSRSAGLDTASDRAEAEAGL